MITASVESFVDCWPELQPHLPRHHAELALYQDRMPLDVDFARYAAWEGDGSLVFVALRDLGRWRGTSQASSARHRTISRHCLARWMSFGPSLSTGVWAPASF
jgi:hypothetical protein